MRRFAALFAAALTVCATTHAQSLLPTEVGTAWQYQSKEESGAGFPAAKRTEIVAQFVGKQEIDGKSFPKLETRIDGVATKEELIDVAGNGGVLCVARAAADGQMEKLSPPEIIVPKKLKAGETWEREMEVAGSKTRLRFAIAGEETVAVEAGNYRAFHFHAAKSGLVSSVVDQWFATGVGLIKEIDEARGPNGGMLQRMTVTLTSKPLPLPLPAASATPSATPDATALPTALPEISPSAPATPESHLAEPEASATAAPSVESTPETSSPSSPSPTTPVDVRKMISAEISDESTRGSKSEFRSDTAQLYVRWQGHNLPEGARVRVVWIAEDVGELVDPNFIVDETETTAPSPDASARFTLSRPLDGWAEGKYRLEVYVDGGKAASLPVRIK